MAFRGAIEDALQSRGFLIPTAAPVGEDTYALVLRNLFPELKDIAVRAEVWGLRAAIEFPPKRVREMAESPQFREKVKTVVRELGANRDSELMTVALLTAEIAGVSVLETLRSASEHREVAAADSGDEAIPELAEAVLNLARVTPRSLGGETNFVNLKQTLIADELNRARRALGKLPIGSQRLAKCRRELGVKDDWLHSHHKAAWWNVPKEFLTILEAGLDTVSTAPIGSPAPPAPPPRQDERGKSGDPGKRVHYPDDRPPLPGLPGEEVPLAGRPNRMAPFKSRIGIP